MGVLESVWGYIPTGEMSELLAALWISLMTFLSSFHKHDHSGKVVIDYAVVIKQDAACNDLFYFLVFPGLSFHQYLVLVNNSGMNIMLTQFCYAFGLRGWLEV